MDEPAAGRRDDHRQLVGLGEAVEGGVRAAAERAAVEFLAGQGHVVGEGGGAALEGVHDVGRLKAPERAAALRHFDAQRLAPVCHADAAHRREDGVRRVRRNVYKAVGAGRATRGRSAERHQDPGGQRRLPTPHPCANIT